MKVLLTGATGFIGSHVARVLLKEGYEVHALVRPTADLSRIADIHSSLHLIHADLLAPSFALQPTTFDMCIHLAWYVEPGKYLNAPQNVDFKNATLQLAGQLADAGCKRLVAAGTCVEYDTSVGTLTETTPTKPHHLYSQTKLATFTALQEFCKGADIAFAWTRFFYQYGPHEDPRRLVPDVVLSLLRNVKARLTPGKQVRDFLHVEDVASAICAVGRSQLSGAVNIGSGRPVTVRAIAETIGQSLGKPELLAFGARQYAPDEPMYIVADNTKLCQETDWHPQFNLSEGLRQTIAWWRQVS